MKYLTEDKSVPTICACSLVLALAVFTFFDRQSQAPSAPFTAVASEATLTQQ